MKAVLRPTTTKKLTKPKNVQRTCTVTLFYHNLAGSDDRVLKNYKKFTAMFPSDDSPLEYYVDYSHHGGSNYEDKKSGHTARDSHLVFKDATGKQYRVDLVDNSGAAHYAKNLQFPKQCPMKAVPRLTTTKKPKNVQRTCTVTL